MKPCSNKRKLIVLLAVNELDATPAQELRAHLQSCEACRRYLEEISAVNETLASVETTSDIKTSESFHRKVVARLQAEESVSVWEIAISFLRPLNWRIAMPIMAAFVVLIGILFQHPKPNVTLSPAAPHITQTAPAPDADADLPPTIANYQTAASQSLQKFDDLLNEQAKSASPSAPVYSASTLTLADGLQ